MKSSKANGTYRPFENLRGLLKKNQFPLSSEPGDEPEVRIVHEPVEEIDDEQLLFERAMAGVEPIEREPIPLDKVPVIPERPPGQDEEAEVLTRLHDLVRDGDGFIVSDTPEYMEGVGYGVNPDLARRLHQGDFSIQSHIDLHGLGVEDAQEAFEQFFKESVLSGKTAVLIVHGRGLSSTGKPILKRKVREWLTSGPWRKWVVAFTSARSCDGGAGATYVLVRKRPVTKRCQRRRQEK